MKRAHVVVDGDWTLHVQTTGEVVGLCGTRAVGHGRRRVKVRGLSIARTPVVLVWSKRVWRCPEASCETATWSEPAEVFAPPASPTERARAEIRRRVGGDEDSVARCRPRLLDVRPGRSGTVVGDWLDEHGEDWLDEVGVVALDPFRAYASGNETLGHRARKGARCGVQWQTRPAAPIRGRQPRLAA